MKREVLSIVIRLLGDQEGALFKEKKSNFKAQSFLKYKIMVYG